MFKINIITIVNVFVCAYLVCEWLPFFTENETDILIIGFNLRSVFHIWLTASKIQY